MPAAFPFLKVCDSIIEILLYFLLVFAPLAYGSVEFLPLTIVESSIFLIAVVWLVKVYFMPQALPKPSFWKPAVAFIILAFLQLIPLPKDVVSLLSYQRVALLDRFFPAGITKPLYLSLSIYANQTIGKLVELLSYGSLFYVLISSIETKIQFRRILVAVILSALLTAILEMAGDFKFPFVNKNHFAGYMEMAVPLAIGYFLGVAAKPQKIIFAFTAIIMTMALFLSSSRAGILCFCGSMVFMTSVLGLRRTLKGKIAFIYALILVSFILAVILGIEPVLERFMAIKTDVFSRESRLYIWADTLRMIKDFVLFGTGLGTFRYIYPVYRTLTVQAPIFYAHSDFLQLISETGLLGLGLAFWLLFLFYKEVFSAWLTRHDPFVKGITIAGLSAMLAILLHSFFDFGLQIPANALFFTVTSAMVYKCIFIKFKEDEPVQVP